MPAGPESFGIRAGSIETRGVSMRRTIRALVLSAVAAAVLVVPTTLAAMPTATTLTGTVGPGFTISLKMRDAKVTKLTAGTYTIKVSDKSKIHNFHLKGPGVNKSTSVSKVGTSTWTVKLSKGTYTYVCDPHKTVMKGSFKVL
jgi:plastocyanin